MGSEYGTDEQGISNDEVKGKTNEEAVSYTHLSALSGFTFRRREKEQYFWERVRLRCYFLTFFNNIT